MDMAISKIELPPDMLTREALLGALRNTGGVVFDLGAHNARSARLMMRNDAIVGLAPVGFRLQWRPPVSEAGTGFNERLLVSPVENPEGAKARYQGVINRYTAQGLTVPEAKALYSSPYSHKERMADIIGLFLSAFRGGQSMNSVSARFMLATLAMSPAWDIAHLSDRRPENTPKEKGFAPRNPHDGSFERWKESIEGAFVYEWLGENIHEFSWYKCRILVGHLKVIFEVVGYSKEDLFKRVMEERVLWEK